MVFTIAAQVTSKRIITGILYGNSASTGRCRVGFAIGRPAHAAAAPASQFGLNRFVTKRAIGQESERLQQRLNVLEAAVRDAWRRTAPGHDDNAYARSDRNPDHGTVNIAQRSHHQGWW